MKRIISLILAISTLVSAFCSTAYAEKQTNQFDDILYYQTFDDIKTNDKPFEGEWVINENSRVIEKESGTSKNKVMLFSGTLGNSLKYTLNTPLDKLTVQFDICFPDSKGKAEISAVTQSGSKIKLLTFSPGSGALTWNGYDTGISATGQNVNIGIAVDTKLKVYSIYRNGKRVCDDWRCSSLSQNIKGVTIEMIGIGEKYDAELDNIKIYTGTEILKNSAFPAIKYVDEAVNFNEEILNEAVGDKVFIDEAFENIGSGEISLSGIGLNNKGNPIKIEYDRQNKSDYLVFEGYSSDPHIDVAVSDATRYMVFQGDFKSGFFTGGGPFWLLRDASGISVNLMTMGQGTIKLPDGTKIVKLEKDTWHNIAAAVDFSRKIYDIYLDKELIKKDIPFSNTQLGTPTLLRIHISSCGGGGSQYCVDNYRIYEAKEPKWDVDTAEGTETNSSGMDKSVFESDDDIREQLTGAVALMENGSIIWSRTSKKIIDSPPVLVGDLMYAPVRAISEAFDIDVGWNEKTSEVTLGDCTLKIGSKTVDLNGNQKELSSEPILINERCMLPLRTICEDILDKSVYWNDGLIVIGKPDYEADDKNLSRAKDFVRFYRPNAEEIKADFETNGKNVHPRIMMTDDNVNNMKKLIAEENETALEYYNIIMAEADSIIDKEPVEFKLPDGYRLLTVCQEVLKRMQCLGIAWLLTKDEKYPERAWEELKTVCEFNTWNYQHHLDVGEMTAACAVGYDWMYDYWSSSQKKFIAKAIYEKSLAPYYDKFMKKNSPVRFQSWTNATNWNAVCNGGTIIGALAAVDYYPDVCYDLISKCIRSTEVLWKDFGPQGSWPEGPGYLIYCLEYICFMISSMDASLGTDYGLINMGEIGGIGNFFAQTDGYTGANNYQDMSPGHQYVAYLYWLAAVRNDPGLGQIQTKMTLQLKNAVDPMRAVSCLQWYDPKFDDVTNISFPLDDKFDGAELFCTRSSWAGDDGMYLSAHGGYNYHNHWHIDSGTFVLDAMGERWAVDYGADNYNAEEGYWGENRYKFYRIRPEGHNCVVINPEDAAGQDMNAFAPITRFETSERSSIAVIDLSETYKNYAQSYRRAYMLGDSRRTVTIRDEIKLKEPGEIYWFMQTGANVEIENNKRAVLTIGFKKMIMEIASDTPYEFYVGETVPLETSPTAKGQNLPGKNRITIKYSGVDTADLTVKFIPYDFDGAVSHADEKPIDSWSLEEGAYRELPHLSMIYVDGEPLYDFNPVNTHYRLTAPQSLADIPQITADAADGTGIEIEQTTDINKPTRIKVYELDRPENAQYYNLGYFMLPKLEPIDGKERYQALSLVASSEPEPDNTKENAFNGVIGDRWAANGKNEWLLIDLGETKNIGKIGTAFIQGDVRIAKYTYKISNDKENWETVFDGSSGGKTTDLEFIDVNKSARYIMFEGHGNSVNTWNSISEIAILAP